MTKTRRETKLDLVDLFDSVTKAAAQSRTVAAGLVELVRICAKAGAAVDLAAIRKLPVAAELRRLTGWLATLLASKPPAKANALYFGIVEFEDGRHDFRCAALPGRGTDTEGWNWNRCVSPRPEHAGSQVLAALSRAAGAVPDAGVRHVFCLGYVELVAVHLCRAALRTLAPRAPLVAVGYDEGDFVVLGKLLPSGAFKPPPRPPAPKPATIEGDGELFAMVDARAQSSAWFLNSPKGAGGRELPYEFAQTGRRVRPEALRTSPYLKGTAVDVSFTIGGDLIVRKRVKAIVDELAAGSVQWLSAAVEGTRERFELMNLLGVISSKRLLAWAKAHRKPVAYAPPGKHGIARVDGWGGRLVVTRGLAEALVRASVTGATFVALETSRLT